jgi:class 3 adenylate cyclase
VIQRVVSPVVVGREEQMSTLEDALLAANRGEGRLVALAGEAGMGKTRLVTELVHRARKLGFQTLWGSCAETELSLPYLPFLEAIGNYLSEGDLEALMVALGPARSELAQLFPQLGGASAPDAAGDAGLGKARLFEAIASLLSIPARERGLLFVVDDVHWADASTRELLDHLTRRLASMRALIVVTYRVDEIDRLHPLLRLLQSWRRSTVADTVKLEALSNEDIGRIIAAIFDERNVSGELQDLMYERSEGNPFVLEEFLKEAIDRGDIYQGKEGWDRKPIDSFRIPESVRDTVLLRVSRLDPAHVEVLECASVLGRWFDASILQAVADQDDATVHGALEVAKSRQLIEEDPQSRGGFRWRHALTQEAIYGDILVTRRAHWHGRAADALEGRGRAIDRVHHLLDAGRFAEAVPECVRAAEEAEAALAFSDAVALYERALPHIVDGRERGEILCTLGVNYGYADRVAAATKALVEGIALLEEAGDQLRAAHYRLWVGRMHWTALRGDLAIAEYQRAQEVLERHGPSADLALCILRLANLKLFAADDRGSLEDTQRAYELAEAAGADFVRIWSLAFIGASLLGVGEIDRGVEACARAYSEAMEKGFYYIAHNNQWNDCWIRVHMMIPGAEQCVERMRIPELLLGWSEWSLLARSYLRRAKGELAAALEDAEGSLNKLRENPKSKWRIDIHVGEVLAEMGRIDEAIERLPDPIAHVDVQDLVYQGPAQIRVRLATGRVDEAVALAREILAHAGVLANKRETLAVAGESLLAAGLIEEAGELVRAGRAHPSPAGLAWLDELEGRILLAKGAAGPASEILIEAVAEADRCGFPLAATRMRVALAQAAAAAGDLDLAGETFRRVALDTDRMEAHLLGNEARAEAAVYGIELPASEIDQAEPAISVGEKMITSLFADIRGYTHMAVATPPEVLVDRLTALYRWGKNEVERNRGMVDKFAGDAVMATFNAGGASVDHPLQGLKAALGLRDKASLMDLPIGIGIAVGPAVVGPAVRGANPVSLGASVNLAARLQTSASSGEIVLSDEVYRRTEPWLVEHGLRAEREELELKGFEGKQVAYRIRAVSAAAPVEVPAAT